MIALHLETLSVRSKAHLLIEGARPQNRRTHVQVHLVDPMSLGPFPDRTDQEYGRARSSFARRHVHGVKPPRSGVGSLKPPTPCRPRDRPDRPSSTVGSKPRSSTARRTSAATPRRWIRRRRGVAQRFEANHAQVLPVIVPHSRMVSVDSLVIGHTRGHVAFGGSSLGQIVTHRVVIDVRSIL